MGFDHTRPFSEASIRDFIDALTLAQSWGCQRVFIADFFSGQPYVTTEEIVSNYLHNISQHVMREFFEQKGFKKVVEANVEDGNTTAAVMQDIEKDHGVFFKGYKNATVCYVGEDGEKLLVKISRYTASEMQYEISVAATRNNLLEEWFAYARKNNFYRGKKITGNCSFLDLKDVSWDDVILPAGTKNLLRTMANRTAKAEIYRKNGLSLKRGIMVKGNPGNGKTTSLRVVAKETTCSVIYVLPSHIRQTSDVTDVCKMAKDLAPTKLIFEDIDWLAEDRNSSGDPNKVIELMNQLDGIEGFDDVETWGSTNEPEKIEAAMKNRPGRFDRVISIDDPDEECRSEMLRRFTSKWVTMGLDIQRIVKFTDKLSGAHMADLCKTAALIAVDQDSLTEEQIIIVTNDHFDSAIKEVKDKNYSEYLKSKGKEKKMGFHNHPDDDD